MRETLDRRAMIRLMAGGAAAGTTLGFPGNNQAAAQAFPSRTITIVVPFQPGGSNDIIARVVSPLMGEDLKTHVIVENKPGASGTLGAQQVARSEPDGHTILIAPSGVLAINQWLFKNLSYDPAKDFVPLTLGGVVSNVLVVHPSVPVATIQELVAYVKSNPGKVNFASMGTGTSGHLCGEMFKKMAGIDINHVPYRGSGPAMNDLVGGQVQMMFDNLPTSLPHIQTGRLRALAITGPVRHPHAAAVPTIRESGYPDFVAEAWFGFVAPAKTPPAVRKILADSIVKALNNSQARAQLEKIGLRVGANSPDEFASYIASESLKWKKVVEESGAKLDG